MEQQTMSSITQLNLEFGLGNLTVGTHDQDTIVMNHQCARTGAEPVLRVNGDKATISPRQGSFGATDFGRDVSWQVLIPRHALKKVRFATGGAAQVKADFTGADIAKLELNHGIGQTVITGSFSHHVDIVGTGGRVELNNQIVAHDGIELSGAGLACHLKLPNGVGVSLDQSGMFNKVSGAALQVQSNDHQQNVVLDGMRVSLTIDNF